MGERPIKITRRRMRRESFDIVKSFIEQLRDRSFLFRVKFAYKILFMKFPEYEPPNALKEKNKGDAG